jgi:imidazolonepropionase
MLRHGNSTCEAKSGFAYDQGEELKVLRALARLDSSPIDVVPTYLAGLPVPYDDETLPCPLERARVDTLPKVADRKLALFADAFLDGRGCSVDQTRRYLETARGLGFLLKVHADQFRRAGGVALAVEMGAASADHVNWAGEEEIARLARSSTVATLIPGASFHPGGPRLAPARALIEAGAAVALASGFSPYGCPSYNMQLVLSLACARLHMTPAEAISAATINGAHAIRQADSCGSLELGKRGDFIVLNVSDYREIPYFFGVNSVRMTVKRGNIVYREGEVK